MFNQNTIPSVIASRILKTERTRIIRNFKKRKLSFERVKYFFANWNDEWYKSLFSKEKCSGDITPNYAKLSEESILKIKQMNPKTKIILGFRNPIDRQWSQIKMALLQHQGRKSIKEIDEQEMKKVIYRRGMLNNNDYSAILDKWRKHFPDEQILVYYYEELQGNPQKLYDKICDFLEIKNVNIKNINHKINKGHKEELPEKYRKMLIDANRENITKFAENYPSEFSEWENSIKN